MELATHEIVLGTWDKLGISKYWSLPELQGWVEFYVGVSFGTLYFQLWSSTPHFIESWKDFHQELSK